MTQSSSPSSRLHTVSKPMLDLLRDRLLRNAGYLLGATVVNAGAGFLFWTLAARLYTPEEVGFASSVISITSLLGSIASLGLGIGLVRYFPEHAQPRRALNAALTLAAAAAFVVASAYLLGIGRWSPSLSILSRRPLYMVGFLVFVVISSVNTLLQMAYLARRETAYAFWQVLSMNLFRLVFVAVFAFAGAPGLVAAVAAAIALAELVGLLIFLPRLLYGFRVRLVWAPEVWRQLVPYSLGNYLSDTLYRAPILLAPPLVLERLGAAASAHAYIAWMIGSMLASPATALAFSTFAEGSHSPGELQCLLARAGRYTALITLPLAAAVALAAPWILLLFGPSYAAEAAPLMRWLAVAAPLMAFANLYFTGLRVRRRLSEMILLSAAVAVISLVVPIIWIDSYGMGSMGQGWLLAQGLVVAAALCHLWPGRKSAGQDESPIEEQESYVYKTAMTKIVVAIPCYNEENFITDVVRGVKKHAEHVIVVDDGSSDGTAQAAQGAGAEVIRHSTNLGPGVAVRTCLEAGLKAGADILVTLDGDGQHDPGEIPDVVAPVLAGEADVVIGSRFLGKPNNVTRYRKFGIDVITWLYNFGVKEKITDGQSGYRAYDRRALEALRITEDGFGFSVETLVQARRFGLRIREASISCVYHEQSHSANPVLHGVGVALKVVKHRFLAATGRGVM